jgi:hypothetical protein
MGIFMELELGTVGFFYLWLGGALVRFLVVPIFFVDGRLINGRIELLVLVTEAVDLGLEFVRLLINEFLGIAGFFNELGQQRRPPLLPEFRFGHRVYILTCFSILQADHWRVTLATDPFFEFI